MILVDGIYINNSGARLLFAKLVESLANRPDIWFLLDSRLRLPRLPETRTIITPSEWGRFRFYFPRRKALRKVFCFGNVPPPVRVVGEVKTYFHNRLFINPVGLAASPSERAKVRIKAAYIRARAGNTDAFLVQTPTMRRDLTAAFDVPSDRIELCPFYEAGKYAALNTDARRPTDIFGFVSLPHPHKRHRDLLEAWRRLAGRGIFPELHLTVPSDYVGVAPLLEEINALAASGVRVVNHGFCDPGVIYARAGWQIYPSVTESFGMGLIEAVEAGCRIVAPDLSYVRDVVSPSLTWNPAGGVDAICAAVESAMRGGGPESRVLVADRIGDIQKFLT